MLGSGAVLGAPSLPKFTTRPSSSPSDEAVPSAPPRRTPASSEHSRPARLADPERPPERSSPVARSPRRNSNPVPVAGRPSAAPAASRPTIPVHRIVDAAVALRAEKVTRLRLDLHPELRIELFVRGGAVHGLVHASGDARDLASHLDHLRTTLEGKGIKVGDLRIVLEPEASPSELVSLPVSARVRLVDLWA